MNFILSKKKFRSVWLCLLLFFFISQDFLDSAPILSPENSWIAEGEILIESRRYTEAEDLANSVLESNPSDIKAEFLLTRAWIGLGQEEKKKENFQIAKQYFEKAYQKWPLNENLQIELSELNKNPVKRKTFKSSNISETGRTEPKWKESLEALQTEIHLLRLELETGRMEFYGNRTLLVLQILLCVQILLQFLQIFRTNRR